MKKIILSIVTVITLFGVAIFGIASIHNANTSSATPSTLPSSSLTSSALTDSEPEETNGVTNITTIKNPENVTNSPIKFEGLFSKNAIISSTSTDPSLISFLRITINSGVAYDTISIQCINSGVGATTYDLKEDEYGTKIGDTKKSTIYYFTRQASYTVTLKKSNEIVASAQCSFSPVINETALKNIYENIQYYDGNYYVLGNGLSEITPRVKTSQTTSTSGIQFDTNLYLLSINNTSVSASDNLYKLTLPANSYGDVKLTFTSKSAYVTRTISLKVVNPKYSWTFLNSNNKNIAEDSRFGSFYIFNEATKLNLVISNTLIDASKYSSANGFDTTFTSTPLDLTNLLTVKTTESIRNIANTTTSQILTSVIEKKDTSSAWTETFDQRNHSIFTISTNLLSTDFVVSDNVVTYKIITKVPYTYGMDRFNIVGGRYDLAIYQHSSGDYYGGVKNEIYNHLNGALNGILTRDTTIYFVSESTTIYNNGATSIFVKFDTSFKTVDPTEDISPFRNTLSTEKEKTVQIKNKDLDKNSTLTLEEFETFYSFTFTTSYYPPQTDANDRFYSNIISSNDSAFTYTSTDRNGNTLTSKSDLNKNYIFTMFKSNNSDDNFLSKAESISSMPVIEVVGDLKLPVYMNIVYNFNKEAYDAANATKNIFWDDNGFENLYQLQKGDKIEFFEPGIYIVELYTFPTHEFAKNFVNRALTTGEDSLLNNNYIRFEFEVEGPSISATSTNDQGVTIPLANRMFTEKDVRISIQLTPNSGQRLIAYRNNIQINSFDSDSTFIMDRATYAGSWTFTVFNKDGLALKSLNFTIIDTAYLGYSINNREEYNLLEVFDSAGNKLPSTHCYDLIDEGNYTVKLTNSDKLAFYLTQDGVRKTTYVEKPASNVIRVNIQKPYFDIKFTNDFEGNTRKTTDSIIIGEVSGIEISKVTVFLNGKQIDEYDPRETTGGIGGIIQSGHSYSQNGVYTIRITDKFNNSFEVQAEKYYKINYALIILIAIAVFAFLFLIWFIYRSRRGLKVR